MTPFNRSYFGWSVYENGLEFMMIGVCALLGYSFVKFTSTEVEKNGIKQKRLDTRYTLLMGVVGCFVVSVMTGLVIACAEFREPWLYCSIFVCIVMFCICLVSKDIEIFDSKPNPCSKPAVPLISYFTIICQYNSAYTTMHHNLALVAK